MLKVCHAVGFICPLITTAIKKNLLRIPTSFGHYDGEFDFECDDNHVEIAQDPPEIQELRSSFKSSRHSLNSRGQSKSLYSSGKKSSRKSQALLAE